MLHPLNDGSKIYRESSQSYKCLPYHISMKYLNFAIVNHSQNWLIQAFGSIYAGREYLNNATVGKKFTPLHFCAISGNLNAAKELLKAGANPNLQDFKGWTALHHAALSSHNEMIKLLIEHGANPSIENMLGGTYEHILNLIDPPRNLSHLRWIDERKKMHPMTEELFREKTNAEYISNCKISREQLWNQEPKQSFSSPVLMEKLREKEKEAKKPLLALGHANKDSEGNALENSCGLGLFAAEDIPEMTILGEYCGQIDASLQYNPYLLQEVNALHIRNETAHINDGFPNSTCLDIANSNGLSKRYLMVAARALKKGEQILWNYGPHGVKDLNYVEIAKKEARSFARTIDSKNDCALINTPMHLVHSFQDYVRVEKLHYLLNTPSVLFLTGFENTLNKKAIKELIEAGCTQDIIPSNRHEVMKKMEIAIKQAQNDLEEWKNDYPKTTETYRHLLLHNRLAEGVYSFIHTALEYGPILKGLIKERAKVRDKAITDLAIATIIVKSHYT